MFCHCFDRCEKKHTHTHDRFKCNAILRITDAVFVVFIRSTPLHLHNDTYNEDVANICMHFHWECCQNLNCSFFVFGSLSITFSSVKMKFDLKRMPHERINEHIFDMAMVRYTAKWTVKRTLILVNKSTFGKCDKNLRIKFALATGLCELVSRFVWLNDLFVPTKLLYDTYKS